MINGIMSNINSSKLPTIIPQQQKAFKKAVLYLIASKFSVSIKRKWTNC